MKLILSCFCLALGIICLSAQADSFPIKKISGISFHVGMTHNRLIDDGLTFNHLKFSGTMFKADLGYILEKSNSLFEGKFSFNSGSIISNAGHIPATLNIASIDLNYLRLLHSFRFLGRESKLFGGIEISTLNYLLENRAHLDNASGLFIHGIYLKALHQIQLNDRYQWRFKIKIPLITLEKRETADGGANQQILNEAGDITQLLFNRSMLTYTPVFNFNIEYLRKLATKIYFSINYNFNFIRNSKNETLRFYNNELLVGFKFNLSK